MSQLGVPPEVEEEAAEEPVITEAKRLEAEINGLSVRLREIVPDGTGVTYRCETCYRLSDEHSKGTVKYCKGKAYNDEEYVRSMTMQRDGLVALIDRLVGVEIMEAELDKTRSELDDARSELAKTRLELDKTRSELAEVQTELVDVRIDGGRVSQAELDKLRLELAGVRKELSKAREDCGRSQADFVTKAAESEKARAEVKTKVAEMNRLKLELVAANTGRRRYEGRSKQPMMI